MNAPNGQPESVEYYPPGEHWVVDGGRVVLLGSRCRSCGKHLFPRRAFCDACESDAGTEDVRLSTAGTLYSFSEIHVAPPVFTTPYVVGYIDLPEDVRLFGQVEHRAADLSVGEALEIVLGTIRKTAAGTPVVSYKFRKSGGSAHA